MSRCEFTSRARDDLRDIHDYIAQNNPQNARLPIDRLERHCHNLADSPYIGVSREEYTPQLRSFVIGRYLIFYRPSGTGYR